MDKKSLTIFDSAHNEAGIKELVKGLKIQNLKSKIANPPLIHFVYGTVNDKDISNILRLLPANARYYFCKADIPRGLDAAELKQQATKYKLKGEAYSSVKKAFANAKKNAKKRVAEKLLSIEKDILRKALAAVQELINELPNSAISPCVGPYLPNLK